jgi:hypothetical protein
VQPGKKSVPYEAAPLKREELDDWNDGEYHYRCTHTVFFLYCLRHFAYTVEYAGIKKQLIPGVQIMASKIQSSHLGTGIHSFK